MTQHPTSMVSQEGKTEVVESTFFNALRSRQAWCYISVHIHICFSLSPLVFPYLVFSRGKSKLVCLQTTCHVIEGKLILRARGWKRSPFPRPKKLISSCSDPPGKKPQEREKMEKKKKKRTPRSVPIKKPFHREKKPKENVNGKKETTQPRPNTPASLKSYDIGKDRHLPSTRSHHCPLTPPPDAHKPNPPA